MRQINHFMQFNPKINMPSSSTRLHLKNIYNTQSRTQKIYSDTCINSTCCLQINSNTFFVRISKQSLEEQKRIYRWRINCNEQFIPISNFKLQSQGNCYNPNILYKIQLAIPKSNFMGVEDLSLTKCINILKDILNGVIILLQYFDPVIFTQKMIYLTQQGIVKIWIDQRFYINPNNQLYTKSSKKITQKQCLRSITEIIKHKCLKTKLRQKLFKSLEDIDNINNCITAIQNFQMEQKLFSVQSLKYSMSTCTGLTLLNTSSLQFSTNNIIKKRKTITLTDKDQSQQKNNRNIASHGYLQQKININQLNLKKQRNGKITYKSQYKTQQKQKNQSSSNTKSHLYIKVQKPAESMIISQLFISNNEIGQQLQKQKKIQQNPQNKKKQKQSYPHRIRKIKSQQPIINQQTSMQTILQRNGWNPKILSLFSGKNVKESFSEGKQINIKFKGFQFKKLHTMAKQLRQSIQPVQEQFDQS